MERFGRKAEEYQETEGISVAENQREKKMIAGSLGRIERKEGGGKVGRKTEE